MNNDLDHVLDRLQVITLLTMGLYPNVCYHKDKRKVLTMESRSALVHKSSVNCSNRECKFQSPFFVFGEKVCGRFKVTLNWFLSRRLVDGDGAPLHMREFILVVDVKKFVTTGINMTL